MANTITLSLSYTAPDGSTATARETLIRAAFAWAYPELTSDSAGVYAPTTTIDRQLPLHIADIVRAYSVEMARQQAESAAVSGFNAAMAQLTTSVVATNT
jgi:uncharacterized membrane protein YwaF